MKFLVTTLLALVCTFAQAQDIKTVYHVNTGVDTAAAVLNNVQNHLNADPKARIVVVTHGLGIDFLLQDAKDNKGREFSAPVSHLAAKGVEFRVCNNTLEGRKIDRKRVLPEATVVPSGAVWRLHAFGWLAVPAPGL